MNQILKIYNLKTIYEINIDEEGNIFMSHYGLGRIPFIPVQWNYMTSKNWNFGTVEFHKDEHGEVRGFNSSNGGVVGLSFTIMDD